MNVLSRCGHATGGHSFTHQPCPAGGESVSRLRYAISIFSLAVCLAGCGTMGLGTAPGRTEVCTPTDADGFAGFGIGSIENTTDSPIVIQKIEFIDANNLTLVGAELEPLDNDSRRGTDYERTPTAQAWVPLGPGERGSISALIRTDDVTQNGSMKGTRVFYGDGSSMRSEQVDIDFWIATVPPGSQCENLEDEVLSESQRTEPEPGQDLIQSRS